MRIPVALLAIGIVGAFAAIGFYRTVAKPDKPWHRWVTVALLAGVLMVPALTGWVVIV